MRARDMPFIFTSGYSGDSGLPEAWERPDGGKPYTPDALRVAFRALSGT